MLEQLEDRRLLAGDFDVVQLTALSGHAASLNDLTEQSFVGDCDSFGPFRTTLETG